MSCEYCDTEEKCNNYDSCDYDAAGMCSLKCLPEGEMCMSGNGPQCCPGKACEYDQELGQDVCVTEVVLFLNEQDCGANAECISKNCTANKCQCTLGAANNQDECEKQVDSTSCESAGCFYDNSNCECVTKQGYCGEGETCISDEDCFAGGKCGDDNKCKAACDQVNGEGLCEKGDKCGLNQACGVDTESGKQMYCEGLPLNNIPVTSSANAGTCQVLNCTRDLNPCRGDSDCCHGSCDWSLNGNSLPGVCKNANVILGSKSVQAWRSKKMHVRYNKNDDKGTPICRDFAPDYRYTKVYDTQTIVS